MFHHCLNYHMTPQNRTDRQRRAFVIAKPEPSCTSFADTLRT